MLETARQSTWILQVADVAAQLKADLARIPVTAGSEATERQDNVVADARRRARQRDESGRTGECAAHRGHPAAAGGREYATRAGANNAHFLLARPSPDTTANDYVALTLQVGSEISAIGAYAYYHLSALQKASRLARELLDPAQRDTLARSVLAGRGVRAALPAGRLRGRPHRGHLGHRVATAGNARLTTTRTASKCSPGREAARRSC
jgi:hypothetical protein